MANRGVGAVAGLGLVIVMLAIPSSNVSAQDRSGVTGGLSIGAGGLILRGSADDPAVEVIQQGDEQRGAASADLRLGGFVNPRLALFFELAIAFSGEKELDAPVAVRIGDTELHFADGTTDLTSNLWAGAVQFWVAPRLWLRGGLGAGYLSRTLYLADSIELTLDKGYGLAMLGAAGLEVWQFGHGAIDVQAHFTTFPVGGLWVNAPTVQVGFSFW